MPERSVAVAQISLNLSQVSECPRQFSADARRATKSDSLDQIPFGVVKAMITTRLKSLSQKLLR